MKIGNIVENILRYTGIKYIYERINGGECDKCKKRKEYLNNLNNKIKKI